MNLIMSVLFLTAVVCQTTGQAQNYDQLDPRMKKFVDMVIVYGNKHVEPKPGHLNFLASGENYNEVSFFILFHSYFVFVSY